MEEQEKKKQGPRKRNGVYPPGSKHFGRPPLSATEKAKRKRIRDAEARRRRWLISRGIPLDLDKESQNTCSLLQILENKVKKEGTTLEYMYDMISLTRTIKDHEAQRGWCRVIREHARTMKDGNGLAIIYETYRMCGSWNFDDYMSATEFFREPQARFWWPRRKVLEGKHHIASQIQDFIEDPDAIYLGFSTPPGAGKSTLIKFLLSFIAGRYPMSSSMYVSYSDGMVKMMIDSVEGMLTDDQEYRHVEIFSEGKPTISKEYKTITYKKPGDFPTIGFVALGGSVTGRTRANKFLVTDDLVKNKEEARSPERLKNLYDDYKSTISTRQIGDGVKQIQLGTIWSIYDPISRMKQDHEDDPRYRFIAIPVWDENEHSNFEYDCVDNYTDEKIRQLKRDLDPVDFSCLYMQQGIQKEGLAFPEDSLQFYNGELPEGVPDKIVAFVDVAFGGGDSLAMPIGYVYGSDVYIPSIVFNRGAKDVTEPIVAERLERYRVQSCRFEANNGGDFYAADIDRRLKENGYHCNITSKRAATTISKEGRIEQYQPDIKKFYFLDKTIQDKEYRAFMTEVEIFSFTSKNVHDDAPDSLAGLAELFVSGTKMVTVPNFRRPF